MPSCGIRKSRRHRKLSSVRQRHRKHVLPRASRARSSASCSTPFERGIAGIERAVQRADAGADHHVGGNAVRGERLQHADLNGAKTAAAGKHKGGLRSARSDRIRTRRVAPVIAASATGRAAFGRRYSSVEERAAMLDCDASRNRIPGRAKRSGLELASRIRIARTSGMTTVSARRTPSRSRNGRARCGCLRGSRAPRTSGAALPACPGCRTS